VERDDATGKGFVLIMADFTIEQKRALAVAAARARLGKQPTLLNGLLLVAINGYSLKEGPNLKKRKDTKL